jgi:hypothetical protein
MTDELDTSGAVGERGDSGFSPRDVRLIRRAINEGWPVTPKRRAVIVRQLMRVLTRKESKPREKTQAARVLMASDAQNLVRVRLEIELLKMELAQQAVKKLPEAQAAFAALQLLREAGVPLPDHVLDVVQGVAGGSRP